MDTLPISILGLWFNGKYVENTYVAILCVEKYPYQLKT